MIFSEINKNNKDYKLPAALLKAINYLKDNDFSKFETGVYEIEGKDIFAQVFDIQTLPIEDIYPEVHKKYIDVQYLVSGKEKIGFSNDSGEYEVSEFYKDRDLIFYKNVENEGFIEARPGCYSIFFPSDIHRPGIISDKSMKIRKVVVKVKLDLLK